MNTGIKTKLHKTDASRIYTYLMYEGRSSAPKFMFLEKRVWGGHFGSKKFHCIFFVFKTLHFDHKFWREKIYSKRRFPKKHPLWRRHTSLRMIQTLDAGIEDLKALMPGSKAFAGREVEL